MSIVHMICFNVPWPADYGGAIASYYHLESLVQAGARVHLHCFAYGRSPAPQLAQLCERVHYYPRLGIRSLLRSTPYIVASRQQQALLRNLQATPAPILSEGTHSTGWLGHATLADRRRVLRMHNVEWQYYAQLAKYATGAQTLYLKWEAHKLYRYETRILPRQVTHTLAISPADTSYLRNAGYPQVQWLPTFHPYAGRQITGGMGSYALYHGDLSIAANTAAARWLISEVFAPLNYPLVIAGKNPPEALKQFVAQQAQIRLIANPSEAELATWVAGAQFHVLHSMHAGGLKLKLLHALYKGRHVLANAATTAGSGLEAGVIPCQSAEEYKQALAKWQQVPVSQESEALRHTLLAQYDNSQNAQVTLAALLG